MQKNLKCRLGTRFNLSGNIGQQTGWATVLFVMLQYIKMKVAKITSPVSQVKVARACRPLSTTNVCLGLSERMIDRTPLAGLKTDQQAQALDRVLADGD